MDHMSSAEWTSAIASESANEIRRMQRDSAGEYNRIAALERRVSELESMLNSLAEKVIRDDH